MPNAIGRISDNDPRFAFLTKKPLPRSENHYKSTQKAVKTLVNAREYNASIVMAMDAFSEYRYDVLTWVYRIKDSSLKMTKKSKKAPEFALSTVVLSEFNTIQEQLDSIHEETMETFEINAQNLFCVHNTSNAKQRHQISEKMLSQLKEQLSKYEAVVRKTQSMLRSTLSFL